MLFHTSLVRGPTFIPHEIFCISHMLLRLWIHPVLEDYRVLSWPANHLRNKICWQVLDFSARASLLWVTSDREQGLLAAFTLSKAPNPSCLFSVVPRPGWLQSTISPKASSAKLLILADSDTISCCSPFRLVCEFTHGEQSRAHARAQDRGWYGPAVRMLRSAPGAMLVAVWGRIPAASCKGQMASILGFGGQEEKGRYQVGTYRKRSFHKMFTDEIKF